MAFNSGPPKKVVAEINVTPLVDVMLVLLVIFMITAPLMFNAIKLQLPKTREVNPVNLTAKQLILSYSKDGQYFLGANKVAYEDLIETTLKEMGELKAEVIFLRADYSLSYGKVARLMSMLKHAGIVNISLVTQIKSK